VKEKIPNRVAAGKAVAARTKKAREQEKKAAQAGGLLQPSQRNPPRRYQTKSRLKTRKTLSARLNGSV